MMPPVEQSVSRGRAEHTGMSPDRRLVAILGSPRRGGNSDALAAEFIRATQSKGAVPSTVIPTDLALSPCDGDNRCFANGVCAIKDGINEIYDQVLAAPFLLIATPVYFMGPPGSLKCFIDRFQAVWARANILKAFAPDSPERRQRHKAFAIFVGAVQDKPNYFRPAVSIVKAFVNVAGFDYTGEIIAMGLESAQDAGKRSDLLAEAFAAGQRLVSGASP
jgi:multimeric flavodoxin WrbA